ncbi:hypothetical protein CW368_00655 [Actinomycetales bacterium SN12]|nr:hypothetical protein CW368_00655 [Actinomycetales bacterium SN12]
MDADRRLRDAEMRLFARYGLEREEFFVDLAEAGVRLRVQSIESGPSLVFLHGVSLSSAVWAPWLHEFADYRVLLVDLPGHGLSGPVSYDVRTVRDHSVKLLDALFDALALDEAAVIAHSLGGMFALWHAASRPGRIRSLTAIGDPAVAFPGVRVRMPLSPMTVPILGTAMLRVPLSRTLYRRLLGQGLSPGAAASAPDELVDSLRFAARRPANAATVASLMHAINRFRRPRPASVLSESERRRITAEPLFCWGADDPFLAPAHARPAVAEIRSATLEVVPGGHAPWLDSPGSCAELVTDYLAATGFGSAL